MHPTSHRTQLPIKDAIDNLGKMRPVKTIGRPWIVMLHRCVNFTWLPPNKFIVSCLVAGRVFLTGVPSIINIDVALVSAIASIDAIVIALRYRRVSAPNKCLAVAAKD